MNKLYKILALSILSALFFNTLTAFAAITGGDTNLDYFILHDTEGDEYTNLTSESISEDDQDITVGIGGHYFYFGVTSTKFDELYIDTYSVDNELGEDVDFEYWDGNSWEDLVETGDDPWDNLGEDSVTWTAPGDWATTSVNGSTASYFMRQNSHQDNGATSQSGLDSTVDQYKVSVVSGGGRRQNFLPTCILE
jgi:hypothetical protein